MKLERNARARRIAFDAWAMAGLLDATCVTRLAIMQLAVGTVSSRRAS